MDAGGILNIRTREVKVYFVTHSTTTDNEADLASGWKDVGLSQLGIQQAQGVLPETGI
jgi:broad specificity phosphatase PhoE